MSKQPIHDELPDPDTATVEELCRPLSATLTTRRTAYFGVADAVQSRAGEVGGMVQRINRMRKRRGKHGE